MESNLSKLRNLKFSLLVGEFHLELIEGDTDFLMHWISVSSEENDPELFETMVSNICNISTSQNQNH